MSHEPINRLAKHANVASSGEINGKQGVDITQAMARLRDDLDRDVRGISQQVQQATDWHYYVKRFPFACLGAAAVAGYCLVPRRKLKEKEVVASPAAVEKLANEGKLHIGADPQGVQQSGLAQKAMVGVGTVVARALMAYAGKRVGELLSTEKGEAVADA